MLYAHIVDILVEKEKGRVGGKMMRMEEDDDNLSMKKKAVPHLPSPPPNPPFPKLKAMFKNKSKWYQLK